MQAFSIITEFDPPKADRGHGHGSSHGRKQSQDLHDLQEAVDCIRDWSVDLHRIVKEAWGQLRREQEELKSFVGTRHVVEFNMSDRPADHVHFLSAFQSEVEQLEDGVEQIQGAIDDVRNKLERSEYGIDGIVEAIEWICPGLL